MINENVSQLLKRQQVGKVLPLLNTEYKRFSEIRKKYDGHDEQLARTLKDLWKAGIIEKIVLPQEKGIPQTKYRISPKFKDIIRSLITKFTDQLLINSYKDEHIISYPNLTYYGLKNDVFHPKTNLTPEYLKLIGNGLTIKDLFEIKKGIYKGQPKEQIGINEAFKIITEKLLEIKKDYRLKELNKNYMKRLKEMKSKKMKLFLKKYSNIFLTFLNESDYDKEWIEKFISNPEILIGFRETEESTNKLEKTFKSNLSEKKRKTKLEEYQKSRQIILTFYDKDIDISFIEKCHNLSSEEKNQVIEFLLMVVNDTIELYPTNIVIVCKTFGGKIKDEYKIDIMKYLK